MNRPAANELRRNYLHALAGPQGQMYGRKWRPNVLKLPTRELACESRDPENLARGPAGAGGDDAGETWYKMRAAVAEVRSRNAVPAPPASANLIKESPTSRDSRIESNPGTIGM